VVIEAPILEGWIRETWRTLSMRMTYWHSARQTFIALNQLRVEDIPTADKLELADFHLRLFALRESNLGTGVELFRSLAGRRPVNHEFILAQVRGNRGYASLESLESVGPEGSEPRLRFESDPDGYLQAIDEFDPDAVDPEFAHYAVGVLEDQIRFLEARGITPIYVVPPTLEPSGGFVRLAQEGRIPNLLVYADPRRYPALYHPASRWDKNHTSKRGSRLFSARFGRDLAALIREREAGE
jgi:hypothetical protein